MTVAVEPTDQEQATPMISPSEAGTSTSAEVEEDNEIRCPCGCNEVSQPFIPVLNFKKRP